MEFDDFKWLVTVIIAPIIGWFVGYFTALRRAKRRRESIIGELRGLPSECKTYLVDFYNERTHTMGSDPGSAVVRLLSQRGIVTIGPGIGPYRAVHGYVSITPDVWEVMDDWIPHDAFFSRIDSQ